MLNKPESCRGCVLYEKPFGKPMGFSRPDGDGSSGVMVVGEALGETEELNGIGFVGKSGHYLFNNLARVGVQRDTLTIFNTIACRPPDNKLVGMSYEQACINHCRPNLDGAISNARDIATGSGKTFVIVTLGKTAFLRILGLDSKRDAGLLKEDYYCYPFWSQQYSAWVLAAPHPSYLMRGKQHETPVLQFAFKRALEIADGGLELSRPPYLLDPDPMTFSAWVDEVLKQDFSSTYLSYDIETPYKQGKSEDEVKKEDADDYTILRCAFSHRSGTAVSIPWTASYFADLSRLFKSSIPKLGWNADLFDRPRVEHNLGHRIGGDHLDGMLAWHVLNSALPKGLGFVAPFYVQNTSMWKHLSNAEPAFYNAKDADMALQIWLGVKKDLQQNQLWGVFDRHVIQLNRIYSYMSEKGVKLDLGLRQAAEQKLTAILNDLEAKIAAVIPMEVLQLKPYAKVPKAVLDAKSQVMDNIMRAVGSDGFVIPEYGYINQRVSEITGMIEIPGMRKTTKCPRCSQLDVKADHYKSVGKKKLAAGTPENECVGLKSLKVAVPSNQWALPLPFKLSNQSLQRYQRHYKHKPILTPKERKITFDDKAITRLMVNYPHDKLYPLIGEFRATQKLLGTYVGITQPDGKIRGGMEVGKDGHIHTTLTHNPSTLRSASENPNLQNLPRPQGDDDLATMIRRLVVANEGHTLYARDFSGIEAVLVGYFALAPNYIRLAKRDVHSFYSAYAIHAQDPRKISANDLPLVTWDDEKLFKRLDEIKKEFKAERNNLYKHLVHGANFMQGAKGAADTVLRMTGKTVAVNTISRVMNIYFDLFPEIRRWHRNLLNQADKDGFLRNPFGYVHRFHSVYSWEKFGNEWEKSPGPDANRVIAFLPQSTAAGIIKEALLRLWENHYEDAGQYVRLLIHDELMFEIPDAKLEHLDKLVKMEMERPIPQMKLPESWNMGTHMVINTEEKMGKVWGDMK